MNKCCVIILIAVLGLISCTKKNDHYYQTHPKELEQAIKNCPAQKSPEITCDRLQKMAARLNELAYLLQYSPQGFGTKIVSIQETIVNQEKQLKKEGTNSNLQANLVQNKLILAEYLAVVKWLESPAS